MMLTTALTFSSLASAKKPGGEPPPDVDFTIVYRELENGSLYLSTDDGSVRLQITDPNLRGADEPWDESPTFSPSGNHIAFLRNVSRQTSGLQLYVINADGTGEQLVTDFTRWPLDGNSVKEDTITWSPTEQEIVYCSDWEIYAVELATGMERPLANFGTPVSDAEISWVRGELAFFLGGDIWRVPIDIDENGLVMPLDLSQVVPMTFDGWDVRDQHPRFSPDEGLRK